MDKETIDEVIKYLCETPLDKLDLFYVEVDMAVFLLNKAKKGLVEVKVEGCKDNER